ncbi:hypothetical protein BCR33DRAFT_724681 [Rhizoclosmatium globosum]|uniref:Uncharacterized protein n=1 Tax=Rhizoclosmatium globosum TaxID=329046 RepID=A0A1Y2B3J8_9FUNG|nr:hypothetical protein BCR33DRAFT_724681 [Rhizoclosmatium globosum]|eukprot:ORY29412.1 hypothetical protein BCR33DRAFT_724681 [Rhizoclosmatium globosum]
MALSPSENFHNLQLLLTTFTQAIKFSTPVFLHETPFRKPTLAFKQQPRLRPEPHRLFFSLLL